MPALLLQERPRHTPTCSRDSQNPLLKAEPYSSHVVCAMQSKAGSLPNKTHPRMEPKALGLFRS